MKRIILLVAVVLGFSVAASAQSRSLGIRGGYGVELSYQHYMNGADFLEADLGMFGTGLNVAGVYNFMIAQPAWTSRGEWGFYAGPGAAIGLHSEHMSLAIAGQVGLEYTFWFPLQLSIDMRPQIGYVFGQGFFEQGIYGFVPTLGIRYRF